MILVFCAKCGRRINCGSTNDWIQINELQVGNYTLPIYGTSCCKSKSFSSLDILWDYEVTQPNGQRICQTNLATLVKICCSIGKSPFSIRKGYTDSLTLPKNYYYFEVKAKYHLDKLQELLTDNEISQAKRLPKQPCLSSCIA